MCDQIPLRDLLVTCSLHNLPTDVTLLMDIIPYQAVMSETKELVNVGDFVKLTSNNVSYFIFELFFILWL